MKMLAARSGASTIGCRCVDDASFQTECDHAVVAQLPDPSLRVPGPADLLHPGPDRYIGKATRSSTIWWRPMRGRGGSQSHSATTISTVFEPLPPLRVVAVAHADETITVLGDKLLRALLPRLEMQPDAQRRRSGRPPSCRGARTGLDGCDGRATGGGISGEVRLLDRGRGSATAALHRVRERKLLENAGHPAARQLWLNRIDDESGSRNVPDSIRRARCPARGPGARRLPEEPICSGPDVIHGRGAASRRGVRRRVRSRDPRRVDPSRRPVRAWRACAGEHRGHRQALRPRGSAAGRVARRRTT